MALRYLQKSRRRCKVRNDSEEHPQHFRQVVVTVQGSSTVGIQRTDCQEVAYRHNRLLTGGCAATRGWTMSVLYANTKISSKAMTGGGQREPFEPIRREARRREE